MRSWNSRASSEKAYAVIKWSLSKGSSIASRALRLTRSVASLREMLVHDIDKPEQWLAAAGAIMLQVKLYS